MKEYEKQLEIKENMLLLEKMAEFFENRLEGYDEHMLKNIESAEEFYFKLISADFGRDIPVSLFF